jgi:hypothetical protein
VVPSSDLGRRTDVTLHHCARGPPVASHLTASRRGFSLGEWLVQPSATAERQGNDVVRPVTTNECLKSTLSEPSQRQRRGCTAWSGPPLRVCA